MVLNQKKVFDFILNILYIPVNLGRYGFDFILYILSILVNIVFRVSFDLLPGLHSFGSGSPLPVLIKLCKLSLI